jgi:hypothetical protein
MSEGSTTRTITVADVSEGPGGDGTAPGASVSLPVVELLTGRGFVTGKSGSGKSNTASVVAERLLDDGFPLLIVDVEGEYYGLKEEYELLHAGADEECDIQVRPEHAEKLASLALEQNVPIILDVSGYLDESVADELVFETARQLFAKEKKLKQPFLLLVEEVHEYIPEGGGTTEAGRMLVKIGKRGRKHGLGLLGISQRPANVKKDYITQCDWLCWHRLTWDNDTQVVRRIIDREHAEAVEDLNDGEAFLMTDWSESIRRVQFHRKRTFDAGATPGLDDFERPDLKSVDDDLVSQLRDITDERERRESELADLRQELERKEKKIEQLEEELSEARDLERMADRFSQALLDRSQAPYRGGTEETRPRDDTPSGSGDVPESSDGSSAPDESGDGDDYPRLTGTGEWPTVGGDSGGEDRRPTAADESQRATADEDAGRPTAADEGQRPVTVGDETDPTRDADATTATRDDGRGGDATRTGGSAADDRDDAVSDASRTDETPASDPEDPARMPLGTRETMVADLGDRIADLGPTTTAMLRHVRRAGPVAPVEAHVEAGGNADREIAYSRMRTLRRAGLVDHVGRGEYAYALPALVREEYDDRLHESDLADVVRAVEESFVDDPVHGWTLREVDAEGAPDAAVTDPDVEIVRSDDDDALRPAFREEDAEYVDEGEIVRDEDDGADASPPDATNGETEALAAEGPTSGGADPRDGHDAEFVD